MRNILVATANLGKLHEIRALLDLPGVTLITPAMLGLNLIVEESGNSYAENAELKALAFVRAAQQITLADDSGLEVDALGGLPGIHSARFSPLPGANDADRRKYLLEQLIGMVRPWTAHFHCTVALATPAGEVRFAEGECLGEIIPEERGENCFGYDPIFLVSGTRRTMAELSMEEKNQLSHRARAMKAALPILLDLIGSE